MGYFVMVRLSIVLGLAAAAVGASVGAELVSGLPLAVLGLDSRKSIEQNLSKLLRRADREGPLRRFIDPLLERGDFGRKCAAQPGEIFAIDLNPAPLHPPDGSDKRPVNHFIDPRRSFRRKARFEA